MPAVSDQNATGNSIVSKKTSFDSPTKHMIIHRRTWGGLEWSERVTLVNTVDSGADGSVFMDAGECVNVPLCLGVFASLAMASRFDFNSF